MTARRPNVRKMAAGRLEAAAEDFELMQTALCASSEQTANAVLAQVLNLTAPRADLEGGKDLAAVANAGLAFMAGVNPADEVQAALGVQMLGTHHLSVEMIRRAKVNAESGNRQAAESYTTMATKLSRTFVAQVEALAKLRSAGRQVIEVQHVHVYPGGQAVVGDVHHAGGGAHPGNLPQPREPIALASPAATLSAPLSRQESGRQPMPGARSEGEEALPRARRKQPRRAKG